MILKCGKNAVYTFWQKFFNFSDEQQKQDERVGSTLVFNTNFASKEVDVGGLKVPDLSSSRILTLRNLKLKDYLLR